MKRYVAVVALVLFAALGYGQKYSAGKTPTNDKSRIALDKLRKGTKPNQILMTLGDSTVRFVDADTAAVIARPYKVYTALLSQTGTSAPTAVVLENTLVGAIVWTTLGDGQYIGTLSGAFTANKTYFQKLQVQQIANPFNLIWGSSNTVELRSELDMDWNSAQPFYIEIRVYN